VPIDRAFHVTSRKEGVMKSRATHVFLCSVLCFASASIGGIIGPFAGLTVFGDSLSDTGNIHKKTDGFQYDLGILGTTTLTARPDRPFYTAKRFTDGRDNTGLEAGPVISQITAYDGVWHEHLARRLKLSVATPSLNGGQNYAYGGAETGTGTANQGIITNVREQVGGFIGNQANIPGNRLYVVWAGGNDLVNAATALFTSAAAINTAKNNSITNLKAAITTLYNKGARKFLWPNLPPLERTPEIARYNDPNNANLLFRFTATKQASIDFKADQAAAVIALKQALPLLEIATLDVFGEFNNILANPGNFNITNTTDPFVRTTQGTSATGEQTNAALGAQPDHWVFWDQLHPTSRIHALLGEAAEAQVPEPAGALLSVAIAVLMRRRAVLRPTPR